MRPLPGLDAARLRGILFDIDDTLTTHGKLTSEAYAAMQRAKCAGLMLVPITGRPAGWCDHIARMWPVDGVVGENGAFYMAHDESSHRLISRYVKDEATRRADREIIDRVAHEILEAVPGSALASDQAYRAADIAIDFCEDVAPLPNEAVLRIQSIMATHGLNAKISSIHVNGWLGGYDKLSTTRLFLRERFAIDLDATKDEFVFIGDSPNDAPMFAFFPMSVGVANVRIHADSMPALPAFVTRNECGAGFVELVDAVLASAVRPSR